MLDPPPRFGKRRGQSDWEFNASSDFGKLLGALGACVCACACTCVCECAVVDLQNEIDLAMAARLAAGVGL
jgi:hypothetical protein